MSDSLIAQVKRLADAQKRVRQDPPRLLSMTWERGIGIAVPVPEGFDFPALLAHMQAQQAMVAEAREERVEAAKRLSRQAWQQYASPVWMDIDPSDTLQRESAREDKDERHICPLQLQVIRRALNLWTNPGDTVLSPFGGIGSEGYVAVEEGRKALLIELKRSYWEQGVRNLMAATLKPRKLEFV